MQMIGVFAELKRAILKERIRAELESARQKGRVGGRQTQGTDQQLEIVEMVPKEKNSSGSPIWCSSFYWLPATAR